MFFISLQLHDETRQKQLSVWCDLFLKYLKHLNIYNINVNESAFPLYYNETLNRRLSPSMILLILERLQSSGHAQPLDANRMEWLVYWHTLEEYGNIIYEWMRETGQLNTVCTLYELIAGDASVEKEFHNMDENLLLLVLRLLENKSKCELIISESGDDKEGDMGCSYGVKFF